MELLPKDFDSTLAFFDLDSGFSVAQHHSSDIDHGIIFVYEDFIPSDKVRFRLAA
jgi:hypothetical protein